MVGPYGKHGLPGGPGPGHGHGLRSAQPGEYSRAPTAPLGGTSSSGLPSPPSFFEAVSQPRPLPMQLFMLRYGEDERKVEPARGLHPALGGDQLLRPRAFSSGPVIDAKAAAARARAQAALRKGWSPQSPRPPSPPPRSPTPTAVNAAPTGTQPAKEADSEAEDADEVFRLSGPPTDAGVGVPVDEHPDAFANAMRLPLRIGQALSVMPADALTGSWSSQRAAYSATVSGGLTALALLSAIFKGMQEKLTLVDIMVVMFYTMSAIASWLFFRLGRYWYLLLRVFRAQERNHGPCPGLRKKMLTITSVLLSVALVEHSLSEMDIVSNLRNSNPNASTFSEYLEIYTSANYPMVNAVIGYWPLLSPFFFFLNFAATFLWNFNDLFIMLISVALASRFKFLREFIAKSIGKNTVTLKMIAVPQPVLGRAYWRSARRSYNALSKLARLVDRVLNLQLLASFVNNLYFICMQLLRGFDDPMLVWYESLYIMFSFGFLVVRASAVSLLAASVHENSRSMQDVLYCVSSEDYSEEVYRFLVQVTSEEVALSGFNMFKVTRGLLLTLAGTILTYEVVLVQFH